MRRPSAPPGRIGVLAVNFGEPEDPTPEAVRPYLERIFLQNVDLEDHTADAAVERAKQLAARRTPGLVEEYREIGGSPLNRQADAQVAELLAALLALGWDVRTYSAFQFVEPSIARQVAAARADAVDHLVVLPVYPLCGASTTTAAIVRVREALDDLAWSPRLGCLAGWHHHPGYVDLRVRNVSEYVEARAIDLSDPDTLLYFSVHGTPVKYLDEGNRYDRYVEEHTREIASALGVGDRYAVGFQNHTNRRIEWTQPDNEDLVDGLRERRLVVVPISFMHEQSETLAELDGELREYVEAKGKEFFRVPVPHDDPRFVEVLVDLVASVVAGDADALSPCRCGSTAGVLCTNGSRELPPSPYAAAARSP